MRKGYLLILLVALFGTSGCLNQHFLLKTDKKYQFAETPDYKQIPEYKISPNDILAFDIYPNSGFNLINLVSSGTSLSSITSSSANKITYLVDADGNVKLPIIGTKHIAGLTIRQLEDTLETNYSNFYNKPFVVATVTNRKVIFFTGSESQGKVIPLVSNNTTLLQLIAMDGGLSQFGKARRVKLVRMVNGKFETYLINLSTMRSIEDANLVLQANDVISIEPRKRILNGVRTEVTQLISLISSTLLVIVLITNRLNQ